MDRGIDSERGSAAISEIINANQWHFSHISKAVAVALANLEAHGYPEPLIVPEPEKCVDCFQRGSHLPACALSSGPKAPIPDVPGWMGPAMNGKSESDDQVMTCLECGDVPFRWKPSPEAGPFWRCSECGEPHRFPPEKHVASWDNPPPCICGCDVVEGGSAFARMVCEGCRRTVRRPLESTDQGVDAKALVLAAWTEGKGSAGEVYYVESEIKGLGVDWSYHEDEPRVESEPAEPVLTTSAGVGSVTVDTGTGKAYVNGEEVTPLPRGNYTASPEWTDSLQPTLMTGDQLDTVGRLYGLERLDSFGGNYGMPEPDEDYRSRLSAALTESPRLEPCVVKASPWPCKCGAGVPTLQNGLDASGEVRWWIHCPDGVNCPNYATSRDRDVTLMDWNRVHGVQPKGETPGRTELGLALDRVFPGPFLLPNGERAPILQDVRPLEPTWDNPGPCVCGETDPGEFSYYPYVPSAPSLFAQIEHQECRRRIRRSTKAEVLSAWVNGEADHE